jgi:hypothetical protein
MDGGRAGDEFRTLGPRARGASRRGTRRAAQHESNAVAIADMAACRATGSGSCRCSVLARWSHPGMLIRGSIEHHTWWSFGIFRSASLHRRQADLSNPEFAQDMTCKRAADRPKNTRWGEMEVHDSRHSYCSFGQSVCSEQTRSFVRDPCFSSAWAWAAETTAGES